MLIGRISFAENKNIILQDRDGRRRVSLTIQDALDLALWIEAHRGEIIAHLQPKRSQEQRSQDTGLLDGSNDN